MKSNFDLESLSRILGWCAIFGLIFVSIWFVAYISGFVCSFKMFDLTPHECAIMSYGGMGIMKMLVYTFFIIPWLAIKIELKRKN